MARQPALGQGLLIGEASRSHSDTPRAAEFLWTGDQPVAETFTWQHTTITTDIHTSAAFEPVIPRNERPQTNAFDRAATEIGIKLATFYIKQHICFISRYLAKTRPCLRLYTAGWCFVLRILVCLEVLCYMNIRCMWRPIFQNPRAQEQQFVKLWNSAVEPMVFF